MTNGSLMKVKSIAECFCWSNLQYFWPAALSDNWVLKTNNRSFWEWPFYTGYTVFCNLPHPLSSLKYILEILICSNVQWTILNLLYQNRERKNDFNRRVYFGSKLFCTESWFWKNQQTTKKHAKLPCRQSLTRCIQETPKQVLLQTMMTQMKCSIMLHFIHVLHCKGKKDHQTKENNIF